MPEEPGLRASEDRVRTTGIATQQVEDRLRRRERRLMGFRVERRSERSQRRHRKHVGRNEETRTSDDHQSEATGDTQDSLFKYSETDETHSRNTRAGDGTQHASDSGERTRRKRGRRMKKNSLLSEAFIIMEEFFCVRLLSRCSFIFSSSPFRLLSIHIHFVSVKIRRRYRFLEAEVG
jgi:hypothetical protein